MTGGDLRAAAAHRDATFRDLEESGERLEDLDFQDCRFLAGRFDGGVWRGVAFLDCVFEGCDLSNLSLKDCRFRDCRFLDCKLLGVPWTEARTLVAPAFERCKLDYSSFQGLDLRHARLSECSAREVDLTGAKLAGCDLRGTDFLGASFARTDLRKADLRGASGYVMRPGENQLEGARVELPEAAALLLGLGVRLEGYEAEEA